MDQFMSVYRSKKEVRGVREKHYQQRATHVTSLNGSLIANETLSSLSQLDTWVFRQLSGVSDPSCEGGIRRVGGSKPGWVYVARHCFLKRSTNSLN